MTGDSFNDCHETVHVHWDDRECRVAWWRLEESVGLQWTARDNITAPIKFRERLQQRLGEGGKLLSPTLSFKKLFDSSAFWL